MSKILASFYAIWQVLRRKSLQKDCLHPDKSGDISVESNSLLDRSSQKYDRKTLGTIA
jgi:hypothetical protein